MLIALIKLVNAMFFAVLTLKQVEWKLGRWFVFCVATLCWWPQRSRRLGLHGRCLQMPPDTKYTDAPAVFNVTNGQTELMNSRLVHSYYSLDGLPPTRHNTLRTTRSIAAFA